MELLSLNDDEIELNLMGNMSTVEFSAEFDAHYGLLFPPQTVLVRAYSDDTDDRMLDEMKPRFIVMFEPCMEFVRRVEVRTLNIHPSPESINARFRFINARILVSRSESTTWSTQIHVKNTSTLRGSAERRIALNV